MNRDWPQCNTLVQPHISALCSHTFLHSQKVGQLMSKLKEMPEIQTKVDCSINLSNRFIVLVSKMFLNTGGPDEVFEDELTSPSQNETDEEKIMSSRSQGAVRGSPVMAEQAERSFTLENR